MHELCSDYLRLLDRFHARDLLRDGHTVRIIYSESAPTSSKMGVVEFIEQIRGHRASAL